MARYIAVSEEETALLKQILETQRSVTYSEIRRTRNPKYRAQVVRQQELTKHLLEKIHDLHAISELAE